VKPHGCEVALIGIYLIAFFI